MPTVVKPDMTKGMACPPKKATKVVSSTVGDFKDLEVRVVYKDEKGIVDTLAGGFMRLCTEECACLNEHNCPKYSPCGIAEVRTAYRLYPHPPSLLHFLVSRALGTQRFITSLEVVPDTSIEGRAGYCLITVSGRKPVVGSTSSYTKLPERQETPQAMARRAAAFQPKATKLSPAVLHKVRLAVSKANSSSIANASNANANSGSNAYAGDRNANANSNSCASDPDTNANSNTYASDPDANSNTYASDPDANANSNTYASDPDANANSNTYASDPDANAAGLEPPSTKSDKSLGTPRRAAHNAVPIFGFEADEVALQKCEIPAKRRGGSRHHDRQSPSRVGKQAADGSPASSAKRKIDLYS